MRGTRSASAPSKASIAAPIAVSSWITAGDAASAGSTRLAVDDHRQPEDAVGRRARGAAPARSSHRVFVLKKRWREVSWNASMSSSGSARSRAGRSPPPAPPREVAALAVGRRAVRDLHRERRALAREPGEDRAVEDGAEVVGVGDEGVAVAALEHRLEHAGRAERRVEVAVAGRRPLELRVRPRRRPAAASPSSSSFGTGSGGSPAAGRPTSAAVARRAPPASPRACGSCSSARAAAAAGAGDAAAQVDELARDDVEEAEPVLDRQQRLGPVIPMLVPRPPLSLMTTVASRSSPAPRPGSGSASASGSSSTCSISLSRRTRGRRPRSRRA